MTERSGWLEMLAAPSASELLARWTALSGAACERQAAILEVARQAASAEVAAVVRQGAESTAAPEEREQLRAQLLGDRAADDASAPSGGRSASADGLWFTHPPP